MASLAEITGEVSKRSNSTEFTATQGVQLFNTPNVAKTADMSRDVETLISSVGTFAKTMYAMSTKAMETVATDHLVQYQIYKNEVLSDNNIAPRDKIKLLTDKPLELMNTVKDDVNSDEISAKIYQDNFLSKAKIDYTQSAIELNKQALDSDLLTQVKAFEDTLYVTPQQTKDSLLSLMGSNIKYGKSSKSNIEKAIIDTKLKVVKDNYIADRTTLFNSDGSINSKNIELYLGDYATVSDGKIVPKEGITGYEALAINDIAGDISLKESIYNAGIVKQQNEAIYDTYLKGSINSIQGGNVGIMQTVLNKTLDAMNNGILEPEKANPIINSLQSEIDSINKSKEPKKTSWTKASSLFKINAGDSASTIAYKIDNLGKIDRNKLVEMYPDNVDDINNIYTQYDAFNDDVANGTIGVSMNPLSSIVAKQTMVETEGLLKNELSKAKPDIKKVQELTSKTINSGVESPYIKRLTTGFTNTSIKFTSLAEVQAGLNLIANSEALAYVDDKTVFTDTSMISEIQGVINMKGKSEKDKLDIIDGIKTSYIQQAKSVSNEKMDKALEAVQTGDNDLFTVFKADINTNSARAITGKALRDGTLSANPTSEELQEAIRNNTVAFGSIDQNFVGNGLLDTLRKTSRSIAVDPFLTNNILLPKEIRFNQVQKDGTTKIMIWGGDKNPEQIKRIFANMLDDKKLTIGDVKVDIVKSQFGSLNIIVKDKNTGKPIETLTPTNMYKYSKGK